jgi:hypothetical protein
MMSNTEQPAANEPMTPQMRLSVMQNRHRSIDQQLHELQAHPWADRILDSAHEKRKVAIAGRYRASA